MKKNLKREKQLKEFMDGPYHYLEHDMELQMKQYSPYHFRLWKNGKVLDIWPSSKKFYNLTTKQKGEYKNIDRLVSKQLKNG